MLQGRSSCAMNPSLSVDCFAEPLVRESSRWHESVSAHAMVQSNVSSHTRGLGQGLGGDLGGPSSASSGEGTEQRLLLMDEQAVIRAILALVRVS